MLRKYKNLYNLYNLIRKILKTFLKWAGNKSQIKDVILKHIEPNCRFIEPFAGSCAISLNINAQEYLISDINSDLINLYNLVIQDGNHFIDYAKTFFTENNNSKEKYYELRELFNNTTDTTLKSALFIYLNKHTFNGLCRYNKKGGFNSPFGHYKNPYFPENELIAFKNKLHNAIFKCQDFRKTMTEAQKGDVIYCDPPYIALSKTSNFTTYSKDGFNEKDQHDLMEIAEQSRARGVKVIISNHNTQESSNLYKTANILEKFEVQRNISCIGSQRKKVNELLAIYHA